MKNSIKTLFVLTLSSLLFQSCESDDTPIDSVADEQKISVSLAEKVLATSDHTNDYDFFVTNANSSGCDLLSTLCYFNNPQGDYYQFIIMEDSFNNWLSEYNAAKLEAFNTTGVEFTNEDFVLDQMDLETGFFGMATREDFSYYFENCNKFPGSTIEFGVPFSDINSNCNNAEIVLALNGESITITDITDVAPVEAFLNTINDNNVSYTMDDIMVSTIIYEAPNGEEVFLSEKEDIVNYFDDCLFNRSTNNDVCLNFVYPIDITRFSSNEVNITLENNANLIETFSIDEGELSFVFPISLLGQDGTILEIATNTALEEALDNSANYCN